MAAQTERVQGLAGRRTGSAGRGPATFIVWNSGLNLAIRRTSGVTPPGRTVCLCLTAVGRAATSRSGIGAHTKRGSPPFLARTSEMKGTPMVRALPTTTCSERWHRPQQPAVLSRRCVCPRASRPAPRRQHLRSLRGERMHRSLTRICRCTTSSRSRSSCAAAAHGFVSPAPCSHTLPSSRRCSWLCR